MINPGATGQLKNIPLTVNFEGSGCAKFKIDGLLGLDTMTKLLSLEGVDKLQIKKFDDILLLEVGDKF